MKERQLGIGIGFVVLGIACVQNNILSRGTFYTLVFTGFCLNISVPFTLRRWKLYLLTASSG